MKKILFLVFFGVVANAEAYIDVMDKDEPKLYHNKPGVRGTSDEDITNKIWQILFDNWHPYEISDVTFEVQKGNVTLIGSVNTLGDKNKIERMIKAIEGVNQIENHLEVIKSP